MLTQESIERCTSRRMRTGEDKLTKFTVSFQRWKRRSVDYRGKSIDWNCSLRKYRAMMEDRRANTCITNRHSSPAMDPIYIRHLQEKHRWCPKCGPLIYMARQWQRDLQLSRTLTCVDQERQVMSTCLSHDPIRRWQHHQTLLHSLGVPNGHLPPCLDRTIGRLGG
jgi:hypothetical protein